MTDSPNSSPVRFGILGCGALATHAIAPALRWSSLCDLVGVASRSVSTAQIRASETQARKAFGTYQEMLDDPEIEAIYIGVPNGLHEEWVLKAAEAGKHILCEKSLTLNSASARIMTNACNEANVLLMESFMYRHHPQWEMIKAVIREGKIGDVRLVRAGLSGVLQDTHNHRWSAQLGGGALYDLTCYSVNVARMLYDREPLSVCAVADRGTREKVDCLSVAIMDFGYGRMAIASGSLSTFNHQYVEIEGTLGRITVERPFIPGWERAAVVIEHGMSRDRIEVPGANHFLHQMEHFALCIRDSKRPLKPAENGLLQCLVNEAIEQSWISGKTVEVAEP